MQNEEEFVDVFLLFFSRSYLHGWGADFPDPLDCEILLQARAKPEVAQKREANRVVNNPNICTPAFAFYYECIQKKLQGVWINSRLWKGEFSRAQNLSYRKSKLTCDLLLKKCYKRVENSVNIFFEGNMYYFTFNISLDFNFILRIHCCQANLLYRVCRSYTYLNVQKACICRYTAVVTWMMRGKHCRYNSKKYEGLFFLECLTF